MKDPVALKNWPDYVYSLVSNTLARKEIWDMYKNGEVYKAIITTLEEWLQEQGKKVHFQTLSNFLRDLA